MYLYKITLKTNFQFSRASRVRVGVDLQEYIARHLAELKEQGFKGYSTATLLQLNEKYAASHPLLQSCYESLCLILSYYAYHLQYMPYDHLLASGNNFIKRVYILLSIVQVFYDPGHAYQAHRVGCCERITLHKAWSLDSLVDK